MYRLKELHKEEEEILYNFTDLEELRRSLLSRFDPYLRFQIQKRGISIIHNTYTGFDPEYELKDSKNFLNKLISVQLAVQSRTLFKVPLYNTLDISYIHPLTSELSSFYKPNVDEWVAPQLGGGQDSCNERDEALECDEMKIINNSFKSCTIKVREKCFYIYIISIER